MCSLHSLWLTPLRVSAPPRELLPLPVPRLPIRLPLAALALFASFCSLFSTSFAAPATAPTTAPASLDALVSRSPFKPLAAVADPRTATGPSRVEFGGFLIEDGQPLVSLTDLTKGTSHWVALRDPRAPYFVESLDRISGTIALRLDGRLITLALRRPATDSIPAAAPTSPPSPGAAVLNAEPGLASSPTPTPAPSAAPGAPNRIPFTRLNPPPRADDRK